MRVIKPGDAIPVILAIGLALAFRGSWTGGNSSDLLLVTPAGSELLDLARDTVIQVPVRDGTVVVQVQGGLARIMASPCPRGTCVRTGWIREPGQTVVCMPEGVFIEIRGNGREPDAVTY